MDGIEHDQDGSARSVEDRIEIVEPITGEPPSILPDPPASARVAIGNGFAAQLSGRALILGPDQWLFINLGEHSTAAEADQLLADFRTHLPPDVVDRIILVAAESMALVPKGKPA
jgi:hypothetical protein